MQKFEANVHEGLLDAIICCLPDFCPQDFFYNAFWVSAIALQTLKNIGRLFCFGGDKKKEETHQLLGTFR